MNNHEVRTMRTTSRAVHFCCGCDKKIPRETEHVEHELYRVCGPGASVLVDVVFECLTCAALNGRPGVAEPDVAEQPLDLGGIA